MEQFITKLINKRENLKRDVDLVTVISIVDFSISVYLTQIIFLVLAIITLGLAFNLNYDRVKIDYKIDFFKNNIKGV